ncbi:glycolate oxidase FAD binding subunit [Paracoccus seriniphilus]|uniref:Glycolate oxidase FAD binding subunit n=2 Tax=Paracoccus seriniphilus TaxID=184748 RepID=A0A239PXT4_9RHOB|nr:glycolate oxidase FAD binding subunit [Paracoccus seriniphilus]
MIFRRNASALRAWGYIMRPESEAELAALIRQAERPLSITGGATRHQPGEGQGLRLDMTGLQGVTLFEPAALTLVVRAGTSLASVEKMLADEGQMLGFEPACHPGSTIGGVFATNSSGPRRIQLGAARDALLGVRFVDGNGEIISNGGRVMKNVTGYDLVKLMAGSRGRLGALTELSLRTAPVPPASCTLTLPALDAIGAIAALTTALGSPLDVSGAGWLPGAGALLRIEGLSGSVQTRAAELTRLLSGFGEVHVLDSDPWQQLRNGPQNGEGDLWRIVCRPSEAPALLAALPAPEMMDWGGGLILLRLPAGELPELPKFWGHARRVSGAAPAVLPAPDPVTARLEAGLRQRFDPRGIFAGAE